MGYRIIYNQKENSRKRRFVLTILVFAIFLRMVSTCWPEGKEILRGIMIPGDPDVVLQAAEVFSQELGSGFSLRDAAESFWIAVQQDENTD